MRAAWSRRARTVTQTVAERNRQVTDIPVSVQLSDQKVACRAPPTPSSGPASMLNGQADRP